MFRNYLAIALRSFWKTKVSSLLNIIGLSTGMLCFILIFLFVKNELSYDRYHKHADHIYRVVKDFVNADGSTIPDATTPPALAPALRNNLPEVMSATRLFPNWGRRFLIGQGEKRFYETALLRVDSSFFDVFDFPFVVGDKAHAFKGPLSILLTEASATKYFGNENPVGKTISIDINNGQDYMVTGILKNVPANSHFTFDFLIPFVSGRDSTLNDNWNRHSFYTYVLLHPSANATAFGSKLQALVHTRQPESKDVYYAQSLTAIHLGSNLKWELGNNGNRLQVNILLLVAVFVIVIAGINYVNLVTAQSVKRAKEVGVRKVTGASHGSLVMQFLVESTCTAFVAFVVALLIATALLPFLNQLLETNLVLFSAIRWVFWIQLVGITFLIGLAAGLYPAFHLSSFQPVKVLKGRFMPSWRGLYLRKSLVVFQFILSIVLMIGFIVIYQQVDFFTQKNLGFNKDNILLVPNVRSTGTNGNLQGLWQDGLKNIPAITHIAQANGIIGGVSSTNGVSSKNGRNHIVINFIRADHAFLPTLQIELKEGRNFFPAGQDSTGIILNEKAVTQLGLQKPYLGQQIEWDDAAGKTRPLTIVGIVKDFHFTSLHDAIQPFAFIQQENNGGTVFIKLRSNDLAKDIAGIQKVWTKYNPNSPFEFTFQDEQMTRLYKTDIRFKHLFSYLTLLAVIIACLGLFGLSIFTAEARGKEIGIRKILGASGITLFRLLSKDFLVLVLIAFVVASPIA
jgi:putative ABC transport system permease protein